MLLRRLQQWDVRQQCEHDGYEGLAAAHQTSRHSPTRICHLPSWSQVSVVTLLSRVPFQPDITRRDAQPDTVHHLPLQVEEDHRVRARAEASFRLSVELP